MKSTSEAATVDPAQRVVPFRTTDRMRREELAFLPAALELVETPPSPIGRMIAATLMLLFTATLAWTWWGTIDIVASATGKIVPSGRTKVLQPFETGVVRAIRVQDGQAVKAGDVLIELDPTLNAAERDHMHNDLLAERLNIARLRAALAGGDDPVRDFVPPTGADPDLVSAQRQLLLNQVTEHRAKLAASVDNRLFFAGEACSLNFFSTNSPQSEHILDVSRGFTRITVRPASSALLIVRLIN